MVCGAAGAVYMLYHMLLIRHKLLWKTVVQHIGRAGAWCRERNGLLTPSRPAHNPQVPLVVAAALFLEQAGTPAFLSQTKTVPACRDLKSPNLLVDATFRCKVTARQCPKEAVAFLHLMSCLPYAGWRLWAQQVTG